MRTLLAAGGVYLLRMSPYVAVSSYLTPFTLTDEVGGIVSVALSLESPLVAVSNCLCPVLPGLSSCRETGDRLIIWPTTIIAHFPCGNRESC